MWLMKNKKKIIMYCFGSVQKVSSSCYGHCKFSCNMVTILSSNELFTFLTKNQKVITLYHLQNFVVLIDKKSTNIATSMITVKIYDLPKKNCNYLIKWLDMTSFWFFFNFYTLSWTRNLPRDDLLHIHVLHRMHFSEMTIFSIEKKV